MQKTRLEKELTRWDLADLSGLSFKSIRNIEYGREPSIQEICAIAKALDVTVDYLLDIEDGLFL